MEYNKVNERIQITLQLSKNDKYKISLSTSRLSEFIPSTIIHISPEEIEKLNNSSVAAQEKIQNLASSISSKELEVFGRSLFEIIFQDEIINEFLTALETSPIDSPLSLAIKVPEELASIWWELLYFDDEIEQGFLSLNESIYFSRYTGNSIWNAPTESIEKLHVLAVASQPPDQPKLDVDAELKILRASIVGRNRVQFDYLDNPTIKEFKKTVRHYKPHIIHFIGHATYQPDGISGLIMADESKESSTVLSSDELAKILNWRGNECRLVILNACETATVGASYQNSIAGALVRAGIPAVIGMQCKIPNNIALVFSESFYAYLLDGFCQPIDYALNNARAFIQKSKINQKLLAKYWCAPVLYSRSRDGLLFTLLERSDEVQEFNRIYKVVLSLGRLNEKSIQPIFEWLQSLGPRALPSLSLALTEGDTLTRQRAAIGLGNLEDYFANELLENQRGFEKNDSVKQAIDRALENANGSDNDDIDPPSHLLKPPRSYYSSKPQSKQSESPKDNSHSSKVPNPERGQPDWETILQKRNALIHIFNEGVKDSESKTDRFKKDFSNINREAKVYLGASKRVLDGIKRLKRWSYYQYMNGIKKMITSKRVRRECDQINNYLETWNHRSPLYWEIINIGNRLENLEKELENYNQLIDNYKYALEDFELKYADSNSRKFYWTIQKNQRDIRASRYKLKASRFKHKIKKLHNKIQENEERVSDALDDIYGTEILTSDRVSIIITRELKKKRRRSK